MNKKNWFVIYNNVFNMFLPPKGIIKEIYLNHNGKKITFQKHSELILYIALHDAENIIRTCDITYSLVDDKLYNKIKYNYNKLIKKKKEGL